MRSKHAVLSALGPRSNAQAGITSQAIGLIVPAMQDTGVRRLLVISAAPVPTVPSPARPNPPTHDPSEGFLLNYVLNPILRRAFRATYLDLAEMEDWPHREADGATVAPGHRAGAVGTTGSS